MTRITKVILILPILFFILLFTAVFNGVASTIQNKYLLVTVDDETGRLFLSTVQGKTDIKGDEKKNLLFYDKPPSSYTLIYLDDDIVTYGDDIGKFDPLISDSNSMKLKWIYQSIEILQEVRFVKRKNTGIKDGVLIKYTFRNMYTNVHRVGFRILFDTYLGENGKYHFELSNGEKLTGEKSFNKRNMPDYWVSKDKKGIICLRGVLKDNSVTTPDRVVFANYKSLFENLKTYHIRRSRDFDYPPYSKNDSAVSLYYNPVKVNPGEEKTISTLLGLCGNGEYESEKPIVEVTVPKEELNKEEKKTQQSVMYHVNNYKAFQAEVESISKLKKNIDSIDSLLKKINNLLEKKDAGEKIDLEKIKDIEKELKSF